jgi:phage tail protein X
MDFEEHITKADDRWDLLAYKFYGNPYAYERLCVANPQYLGMPILPSGVKLRVPRAIEEVNQSNSALPPWKRR